MTAAAILHKKRGTIVPVRHNGRHLVSTETPLHRFMKYCRFDPCTGCVVWTGGTTQGRGHSSPYGAFWFEGKRWSAHRWAAKYIHGLDISDPAMQVDHCCPHCNEKPNTLCVEHVQVVSATMNRELQWIRVQVGLDEPPLPFEPEPEAVPFFTPPAWLLGQPEAQAMILDCPF